MSLRTIRLAVVLAEEGAELLQGYHFGRPALEAPWPRAEPTGVVQLAEWTRPVGRNCAG